MIKILRNRQGIALAFPLFFLILMTCCGFVLGMGQANMYKAELQTMVDASSLAGASTAEIESDVELQVDGENIVVKEVIKGLKIQNHELAHSTAEMMAKLNGGTKEKWQSLGSEYAHTYTGQTLDENETGWAGQVTGDTTYHTEARLKMPAGFLSFLGFEHLNIYVESDSDAFLQKRSGNTD